MSDLQQTLDALLAKYTAPGQVPAYGLAVVRAKEVLYLSAAGYANIEEKKPFTVDTICAIASMTKLISKCMGKMPSTC